MTNYTEEEKRHARVVLGFRNDDGTIKALVDRDKEELLDTLRLRSLSETDKHKAHLAAMEAMEQRLKAARRARGLANRRADTAVKMMEQMLESFKEFKVEEK